MTTKRKGDADFAKYPHFVPGSITWVATANKQRARCKCTCGKEYECFTSDIHQLPTCETCREKNRTARKTARKSAVAAAVAKVTAEVKETKPTKTKPKTVKA